MLDLRTMAALAILGLCLGCSPAVETTPMSIDRVRYDLAVARFPAAVGVYFPADFYDNNFYHTTADDYQQTFHTNPATATRQALDLAFNATFANVRYLDSLQQGAAAGELAFVIVPSIAAMPTHLDEQVIAVGVVYQFEFFAGGRHTHPWQVAGLEYTKKPAAPSGQAGLPRRISADEFDTVARAAVWDAVSVLLAGLDRQQPLTARLPAAEPKKQAPRRSAPGAGERLTLALLGPVYDQGQEPEMLRFERCLLEEIEDNAQVLQPLSQGELRDRLFPWLSRSNYPQGPHELETILARPVVRERLRELGVHYLLHWDGETIKAPFTGPFYITPYGAIGYESADKVSTLRGDLLATADGRYVTSFESRREGTDTVLGLVLVPVPIATDTEGAACAELTGEVDAFLQARRAAERVAAGRPAEE